MNKRINEKLENTKMLKELENNNYLENKIIKKWIAYPKYNKEISLFYNVDSSLIREAYSNINEDILVLATYKEIENIFNSYLENEFIENNLDYIFNLKDEEVNNFIDKQLNEDEDLFYQENEERLYNLLIEDITVSAWPNVDYDLIARSLGYNHSNLFDENSFYHTDTVNNHYEVKSYNNKSISKEGYSFIEFSNINEVKIYLNKLQEDFNKTIDKVNCFTLNELFDEEIIVPTIYGKENEELLLIGVNHYEMNNYLKENRKLRAKIRLNNYIDENIQYLEDEEIKELDKDPYVYLVSRDISLSVIKASFNEMVDYYNYNYNTKIDSIISMINYGYYVISYNKADGLYSFYNLYN